MCTCSAFNAASHSPTISECKKIAKSNVKVNIPFGCFVRICSYVKKTSENVLRMSFWSKGIGWGITMGCEILEKGIGF